MDLPDFLRSDEYGEILLTDHRVIAFYVANRAEVDQYMQKTRAEIDRQAAAPARGPSLAELQRRLDVASAAAAPSYAEGVTPGC